MNEAFNFNLQNKTYSSFREVNCDFENIKPNPISIDK